jgi:hypothetical protein
LDFPLSNYRFYRLQMNDSTSEPLNILSVGFYRHMHRSASYAELSPARVSRIDSAAAKQTIIHLVLGTEHWIDRIRIEAAGPPFFLRAGAIYETSAIADKKGRSKNNAAYLEEFSLSNDEHAIVDVPSVRTNALRIVINNDDNPPLKDVVVKVQQRKRFAICYLEEGRLYRLMAGTEGMHAPRYDLAHFKHRLPVNMLSIGAAAFSPIAKERVQSDEKVDFLQTRYIVWVAIILIMVLLGGLSVRMIRENNLSGKS